MRESTLGISRRQVERSGKGARQRREAEESFVVVIDIETQSGIAVGIEPDHFR